MLKLAFAFAAVGLLVAPAVNAAGGSLARFREVQVSSSSLGNFAGATSTWRTVVKLNRSVKSVGTGTFVCVRIRSNELLRGCRGSYRLPEGEIELAGVIRTRSRYSLVVTGGSGVYSGMNGTAAISQIGSHPWTAFLTFYFN